MAVSIGNLEGRITLKDEFTSSLDSVTSKLAASGQQIKDMGGSVSAAGKNLTQSLTLPLLGAGAAAVKMASDFESSFAGVRKTVDATEEEFKELSDGLRELSLRIPVNVNELNNIAEAAGQLGISKENIIGFTETVAALGVATNLTAEEAAVSLAKIANITGLPQDEFDRLGSAVVALGNNFATQEDVIVEFGLRIGGAGKIAGLAQAEIMAIGAAVSSVGVSAEAGGTAIQKVLIKMTRAVQSGGDDLAAFAKAAGQSVEDFSTLFREDAAGAFTAFVEGLGKQGDKAFDTLDELNLKDSRLHRTFIALAGAGDLLSDAMDTANQAFADNTALAKEAEQRYTTFESQLTIAWNRLKDIGITIGLALLPVLSDMLDMMSPVIDLVADAARAFTELPDSIQATVLAIGAIVAAVGPAVFIAGQLITAWGSIVGVLSTVSVAVGKVVAVFLGPVGWIAAATALLLAWKPVRDFLFDLGSNVFDTLSDWVGKALSSLREFWEGTATAREFLVAFASVVLKDVVLVVQEFFKWIGEVSRGFVESARSSKTWASVMAGAGIVLDAVIMTVKDLWGWLKKIVQRVVEFVGDIDILTDAVSFFSPTMGKAIKQIKDWASEASATMDQTGNLADEIDETKESTDGLADRFKSLLSDMSAAGDGVDDFGESVNETGDAVDGLGDSIKAVPDVELEPIDIQVNTLELEDTISKVSVLADDLDKPLTLEVIPEIDTTPVITSVEDVGSEFQTFKNEIGTAFSDMVTGFLSDSEKVKGAVSSIFGEDVSEGLSGFIDKFTSGFSEASESGAGIVDSLKGGWDKLLSSLTGTANGFVAGINASTGSMMGLAEGAASAMANFATGNWIGAITALAGTIIGMLGSTQRSIGEVRKSFNGFIDNIIAGEDMVKSMGGALTDFLELVIRDSSAAAQEFEENIGDVVDSAIENIANMTDSAQAEAQALNSIQFVKSFVSRMLMGEGGVPAIEEQLTRVKNAFFERMAEMQQFMKDQSTAILTGLEKSFGDFADLTVAEFQFVQTSVVQAFNTMMDAGATFAEVVENFETVFLPFIEAAQNAGFTVSDEFLRIGEVMDIMSDTSLNNVIRGLEGIGEVAVAVGNLGLLTAEQFTFFGDSAVDAFRRLQAQGLTASEAVAIMAPQLQQLLDLQEMYGFKVDETTQELIDQAIAQGAITEKGLDMTDILIRGFEAMLVSMNRLIEAMGGVPVAFAGWEEASARMTDGVLGDFDKVKEEAEETAQAVDNAMGDTSEETGAPSAGHAGEFVDPTGEPVAPPPAPTTAPEETPEPPPAEPPPAPAPAPGPAPPPGEDPDGGFAGGTGGFLDFGKATSTVLHGEEEVITRPQAEGIATMVQSAIESASGDQNAEMQLEVLQRMLSAILNLGNINEAMNSRLVGQDARTRTDRFRGQNIQAGAI
jgi:TP901 family phage tail tape measure protein